MLVDRRAFSFSFNDVSVVPMYWPSFFQTVYSSSDRKSVMQCVSQVQAYHRRGRSRVMAHGSLFHLQFFCGRLFLQRSILLPFFLLVPELDPYYFRSSLIGDVVTVIVVCTGNPGYTDDGNRVFSFRPSNI